MVPVHIVLELVWELMQQQVTRVHTSLLCTSTSYASSSAGISQAKQRAHSHLRARCFLTRCLLRHVPRHNQVGVTLLLDDFPRTLEQAREFERMIGSPVMVLRRAAGQGPRPRSSRGPVLSFGVEAQTDRREGGGLSVPAHARGISPGTRVHCRLHTSIFPLRRRVRRCCFSSCPRF